MYKKLSYLQKNVHFASKIVNIDFLSIRVNYQNRAII